MVKYTCHHCQHVWNYLGTSQYYITCPRCHYKIKVGGRNMYIPKPRPEIKQKPTLKGLGREL